MKWTDKQIGKVLGLHVQTIKKRREKLKLNKNNRNPEAKELRKAKLNKRNEDIKECFSSGKSIEEITQTYRLKVNTVKKILGMIPQEQSSTIHSQ